MKSYVKMPNKHILQNKFCCVFCGGKHWATQIQSISDTLWLFLCLQCGNCLESDIYLWWIDGLAGATYGMHECSCLTFRTWSAWSTARWTVRCFYFKASRHGLLNDWSRGLWSRPTMINWFRVKLRRSGVLRRRPRIICRGGVAFQQEPSRCCQLPRGIPSLTSDSVGLALMSGIQSYRNYSIGSWGWR